MSGSRTAKSIDADRDFHAMPLGAAIYFLRHGRRILACWSSDILQDARQWAGEGILMSLAGPLSRRSSTRPASAGDRAAAPAHRPPVADPRLILVAAPAGFGKTSVLTRVARVARGDARVGVAVARRTGQRRGTSSGAMSSRRSTGPSPGVGTRHSNSWPRRRHPSRADRDARQRPRSSSRPRSRRRLERDRPGARRFPRHRQPGRPRRNGLPRREPARRMCVW